MIQVVIHFGEVSEKEALIKNLCTLQFRDGNTSSGYSIAQNCQDGFNGIFASKNLGDGCHFKEAPPLLLMLRFPGYLHILPENRQFFCLFAKVRRVVQGQDLLFTKLPGSSEHLSSSNGWVCHTKTCNMGLFFII